MNSLQAINLLNGLEQSLENYCELNDEGKEAFRVAVTALELFGNAERLPSAQPEEIDSESCNELKKKCEELKAHIEYLRRQNDSMKGEIKALIFAVRCCGVSGNEVQYESN